MVYEVNIPFSTTEICFTIYNYLLQLQMEKKKIYLIFKNSPGTRCTNFTYPIS